MNMQTVMLKTISAIFMVAAAVPFASSTLTGTGLPLFSRIVNAALMLTVAAGLLGRLSWARQAAILILTLGFLTALLDTIADVVALARAFAGHPPPIAFAGVALVLIAQAALIWWLSKPSTKVLFTPEDRRVPAA